MISNKIIFVAPLDWGLGHATRCVPVIRGLINNNNKIILGITPITAKIFQQEFPELEKENLPPYNIKYSSFFSLGLKLLLEAPRIFGVIKKEKKILRQLILKHKIDLVISDNRFGLYGYGTHTIFITHQLFLKTPFARFLAQGINKNYILKFDEVWVPDYEGINDNLSGELSHGKPYHSDVKFIGPQSRLIHYGHSARKYDFLFLLSGPEPQQSILKKLVLQKVKQYPHFQFAMVSTSGAPDYDKNLECVVLPDRAMLGKLIGESKTIICRSGYSTLMDLHALNVERLILVPTPGQTEQEYLAEYWKEKYNATVVKQKKLMEFNLSIF